jgi:hypothetical protein
LVATARSHRPTENGMDPSVESPSGIDFADQRNW